jgi:hypothetical protein
MRKFDRWCLGDEDVIFVLRYLIGGERFSKDVITALIEDRRRNNRKNRIRVGDISRATFSNFMTFLVGKGFIERESVGRETKYRLKEGAPRFFSMEYVT